MLSRQKASTTQVELGATTLQRITSTFQIKHKRKHHSALPSGFLFESKSFLQAASLS
jgi:hypothetical protein